MYVVREDVSTAVFPLTSAPQLPVGQLILSSALAHHAAFGCGTTSLVCLAALWSREILDLHKQVPVHSAAH